MLNKYVWDLYLNSGGQEVVDFFKKSLTEEFSMEYYKRMMEFRSSIYPDDYDVLYLEEQVEELAHDEFKVLYEEGDTEKSALELLYNAFNKRDIDLFKSFINSLDYYSVLLSIEFPGLFVPYHFKYNFNMIELIAQEFGIDLPQLPVKSDYKGRFFYFSELMEAFNKFKKENNLSTYEFCAFLYDFAPKYIGGVDSYILKDLPEPKGAYFIGGKATDPGFKKSNSGINCWQCNPDTRPGDMIVMYLLSPDSAVSSIWRSVSPGFNDPFFFYYRMTYIADQKKVRKITLKRMRRDKTLKKIPLVRKNMQGVNGTELKPSEYNYLIDLTKSKDIPKLELFSLSEDNQFQNEKEVENQLIKPLIKKLGYEEQDYTTQLWVPIGNHNKVLIPDFVIQPSYFKGCPSGEIIIEAKHSISSPQFLNKAWQQARSYAKQLGTKYCVIASKDAIWIYNDLDDYADLMFTVTWNELENPDKFQELYKILGK